MEIAIIGGGPAGLRAAEVAATSGAVVTVYEAKASVGRKFLVAGRGGLNLSKEEEPKRFTGRYHSPGAPEGFWEKALSDAGVEEIRQWARALGVETFVASTGRIYPRELKAAPLLRRWVERLRGFGVRFAVHHRWVGFGGREELSLRFEASEGEKEVGTDAAILALGGGSWPQTGSNGGWVPALQQCGIEVAPLLAANAGWECDWSAALLAAAEGAPLKSVAVSAGCLRVKGELLLTRYGLEGGALYQLGPMLRTMSAPALEIDFKPEVSPERLLAKLGPVRRNWLAEAVTRWRLGAASAALLREHEPITTPEALVRLVKSFPIPLRQPRPLAEAISSAGGVRWPELDEWLMLRRRPGVFVAGEMVDWEAPTGGYLLHGCWAMGALAAQGALRWAGRALTARSSPPR